MILVTQVYYICVSGVTKTDSLFYKVYTFLVVHKQHFSGESSFSMHETPV